MSDFNPGQLPEQPPTIGNNADRPIFGTPPQLADPAPNAAEPDDLWAVTAAPESDLGSVAIAAPPPPRSEGGNGRLAWLAAMFGVVVLVGGGLFFALRAFSATGGAASPDEAVSEMIAAINGEDFITIGELLDPGERRTIVEPMLTDILPELQRLGVFDETFDAADVDGVDFELTDVTWRTEPIGDSTDLQAVYFTGGNASSETVAAEVPWGDAIRDLFGDEIQDSRTNETITETDDALVLVERDGRWYFSMWHSVAESARKQLGEPLPAQSEAPDSLGADTPEQAVEGMINALFDVDPRAIIGHLDPDEAAALYRYSPLFLDDVDEWAEEPFGVWDDLVVSVTDLAFTSSVDGDDAEVRIAAFTLAVTAPDVYFTLSSVPGRISVEVDIGNGSDGAVGTVELEGRELRVDMMSGGEVLDLTGSVSDGSDSAQISGSVSGEAVFGEVDFGEPCGPFSLTIGEETQEGCFDEVLFAGTTEDEMAGFQTAIDEMFVQLENGQSVMPVTAHRTDGAWYVSPTLSVMDNISRYLNSVSREDFEEAINSYSAILEGAAGSVGSLGGADEDVTGLEPTNPFAIPTPVAPFAIPTPVAPPVLETYRGDIVVTEPGLVSRVEQLGDFTSDRYGISLQLSPDDLGAAGVADVTISVLSGSDFAPDPLITLFDESFVLIDENDDAPFEAALPNGIDSQITIAADNSDFVLSVGSFDGIGGEYELLVEVTPR